MSGKEGKGSAMDPGSEPTPAGYLGSRGEGQQHEVRGEEWNVRPQGGGSWSWGLAQRREVGAALPQLCT